MARVNFVAEKVGDTSLPGVQAIISRLKAAWLAEPRAARRRLPRPDRPGRGRRRHQAGAAFPGERMGPGQLGTATANAEIADQRAAEMLQLIAATREYQFG